MPTRNFDLIFEETIKAKKHLRVLLEELAEYAVPELRTDLLILADTIDEDVCRVLSGFEP